MIAHITDHADQAEARLPEQYKGQPNIVASVRLDGDRAQTLEDIFYDMLVNGSILNQHDSLLDQTGDVVVQPREGLSDDDYKVRIFAKIAENVSKATAEELIRIYKVLMQADRVYFNPVYPAGFSITAIGGTPLGAVAEIKTALTASRMAGVSIEFFASVDSVSFSFSDDPDPNGQGFGDSSDASVGGYLAQVL